MELTNKQYTFICELIFGCVPIDKKWVLESQLFKSKVDDILTKYPKLDVSFFEEHKTLTIK
jgi:hypothetical protein